MSFEELSGIWNSQNIELEKSLQINRQLVKSVGFAKVKSGLREIQWRAIIGIPAVIVWMWFLGGFILENFFELKFLLPALLLLALSIFSLALEVYRLVLFYTIDSKSSVVEAQKKLVRLKKLEILDIYSLLVIIPLFSAPFLIVFAKAVPNLNVYALDLTWLISYTAGSVLIAAVIVFILKKFPNKNLTESISFLEELKEHEK